MSNKESNKVVFATEDNPAITEFRSICIFWIGVVVVLAAMVGVVSLFY